MSDFTILVINAGSSSLKMGLYRASETETSLLQEGEVDGIGDSQASLRLSDAAGTVLASSQAAVGDVTTAFARLWTLMANSGATPPDLVGHRVVHGGPRLIAHCLIDSAVLQTLIDSTHFAPLHIPSAVALIQEVQGRFPATPNYACFDTAFHRNLPACAAHFPIPARFYDDGVRRYGFHGLSYESIVRQLGEGLPSRLVVAHLGSGASLAAIRDGVSIDTSMGLTPTGGIPMATRTGDIDPGVILFLARRYGYDLDQLEALMNREAGLKALSGGEDQVKQIVSLAANGDPLAELALEVFCQSVAKIVAAYTVPLGGIDALVFTGGIGEHSPEVRLRVCRQLGALGVSLDGPANQQSARSLSCDNSAIEVLVLRTQEDLQIAIHAREFMPESTSPGQPAKP